MALAYLDTSSGIAGDMTLAALIDAGADADYLLQQIHSLGLPKVSLRFSETQRHCFRALRLDVEHPPEHEHRHLSHIEAMIDQSQLSSRERSLALRLFRRIGAAEAKVHGTTLEEVHFHEVGAVDSIVDIVGVAVALTQLNVQRIVASPTPTGCGTIHIAHGPVSVPAPATAELLRGIPIRASNVAAELTTPTGAAILATLVDQFGPLPSMQIERIGYGAGHKDFAEQANVLRVLIGQPLEERTDDVVVLETNLDDISGEQIGFAIERVWEAGALDVYTTPISMKKNRPATLLSVICTPAQSTEVEECLLVHTGSLGVRRNRMSRRKLHREIIRIETRYGTARVKVVWADPTSGDATVSSAVRDCSPEYDDCRRFAIQSGETLDEVFQTVITAARAAVAELPRWQLTGQVNLSAWDATRPAPDSPRQDGHNHSHDHDHGPHDHHHH